MTFPDGLVGATGNQTSGGSNPRAMLPPNKVPTSVVVTGYNELALVTVWDTETFQGQVGDLTDLHERLAFDFIRIAEIVEAGHGDSRFLPSPFGRRVGGEGGV